MRWVDIEHDGLHEAALALRRWKDEANAELEARVRAIIEDVRIRGDEALLELGRRYDAPSLDALQVSRDEWDQAVKAVKPRVRKALDCAAASIESFHASQVRTSWVDLDCAWLRGQMVRPLEHVGVYVPGGRAVYPSSVLMCAIPARVAGVSSITLCTPAARDGSVPPPVLYAARRAGVCAVFKVGGAQAIAAMAYGTKSVSQVDKIVGPGNAYVCAAKKALWGVVDMDMIAGPSEVCVVADATADPRFVAADLLTQAEHDPDCAVFLVTTDRALARAVERELRVQLRSLERRDIAARAMARNAATIVARTLEEALELANLCAPEHLALHVADPIQALGKVRNAGAVMLGSYTPQTVGDYLAGPSHTLPTGGTARFWSPLHVDTFQKKTSFMSMDRDTLAAIATHLEVLAMSEGFQGHAQAVRIRLSGSAGTRQGHEEVEE